MVTVFAVRDVHLGLCVKIHSLAWCQPPVVLIVADHVDEDAAVYLVSRVSNRSDRLGTLAELTLSRSTTTPLLWIAMPLYVQYVIP